MIFPRLALRAALGLAVATGVGAPLTLRADNPAIFVKFSTTQAASTATTTTPQTVTSVIPSGWSYAAAAPVAGNVWNRVLRPNPLVQSNVINGANGTYGFNTATNLPLVDSTGAATTATLTGSIVIADLESGSTRVEPNTGNGGNTTIGPAALMGEAWRIYRGGNSTIFKFSGLPAGANYYVYFYGSTTAAGQGCKFTVAAANVPAGAPGAFIDTRGAAGGNVFALDGTNTVLTTPAAPNTASTASDNTTWGRVHAVVDGTGALQFTTSKNAANGQYFNGVQLMPYPRATFTNQPSPTATAVAGSTVSFVVAATGDGTLTYQWRKDSVAIAPAANASAATAVLTLTGVTAADEGAYDCVVTNPGGSITSTACAFTISTSDVAPSITTHPANANAVTGGSASFSVVANGTSPTFQWQKSVDAGANWTDVAGGTAFQLNLNSITTAAAGFYRVVVANNVGSVTSNAAALTVAPVVSTAPVQQVVALGANATLSVVADVGAGAPAAPTYVWKRNGVTVVNGAGVSGATTATLDFTGMSAANAGYYTVTVANSAGSITTASVYFGVPSVQPVTFAPGNNATGIAIDQQLRLVFPSAPQLGKSGKLTIRDAADDSLVATIDRSTFVTFSLFSASWNNALTRTVQGQGFFYLPIHVYGNEVWVTLSPTQKLAYGKTYYVNIEAALLLDSANAAFPAVTDSTTWRFSTKPAGPATPTASTGQTTITVGLDGAGDFATLQGASDWIPQNNTLPRTIVMKPGVYREMAIFAQNRNLVTIRGESSVRTAAQIYYQASGFSSANDRGCGTLRIESSDVTVRDLTIDNGVYVAQPAYGAPAFAGPINTVATTGKRLVFDNIQMKGGQDTLYTITGIAYFHGCEIWGSVDFIYGDALGLFHHCDIVQIRNTGGPVGAPSTPAAQPHGEVFLECRFPRALVANGFPYDVGVGTTTFMRPWRQDGATAIINCQLDTHFSTKAWSEWDGRENTCRAREFGNTMISGGGSPTPAARQGAGAYWLNTIDPDYTTPTMLPTDPLLAAPGGITNRTAVTVDPADYSVEAIFSHPYYALGAWRPSLVPRIVTPPAAQSVTTGQSATFTVVATGTPAPTYQWFKDGAPIAGATSASYAIAATTAADAGVFTVTVTNAVDSVTSAGASLTVVPRFVAWAAGYGLDATAPGFAAADFDRDGVSNLVEFITGSNPANGSSVVAPNVSFTSGGGGALVFTYNRVAAAVDITAAVEFSANLAVWMDAIDGVNATIVSAPLDGSTTQVTVTIPTGGAKLFARLRASE